ncbi:MAG: ThuA domain-containing protein [Sedimentisphaerales bacterium]|nr:ThuA domain-containing protein [Sedimentisphaerales bacterium]
MKYKVFQIYRLTLVISLIFTASARAISEQEIQKITEAMPDKPVVQPAKERILLVFSLCNGYKHSSIPYWNKALDVMSEKTGAFKVVHSVDMNIINAQDLQAFDAICFNNTTRLTPDEAQQNALMNFIKGGKGIIGIHAATDNFYNWPEGTMMMGGLFNGHPWYANGVWAIKLDDPSHPLMRPFGGKGFQVNDEIYRTSPPQYSRFNQRVLMSLDMSDANTKNAEGITAADMDTGISWIKSVGKGRLFYCALGHNHHLTWTTPVLEHYLAGIQYALGDLPADDTPQGGHLETLDVLIEKLKEHDWDKSPAPLYQLNELINTHAAIPAAADIIENKLLDTLNAKPSPAAQDYICRKLAVIGSEKSIPILAKLLTDPPTTNPARYALENIPGPEVDNVLLTQLEQTNDPEIQTGVITTLGVRRVESAVGRLAVLAENPSTEIAAAAIQALGYIGGDSASKTLLNIKSESLQNRVQDALLSCAQSFTANGQNSKAENIYRKLYNTDNDDVIQAGALMGLIGLKVEDSQELILQATNVDNAILQRAASQAVSGLDNKAQLQKIADQISRLSPSTQIQLVTALAKNPLKIGRQQVEPLTGSSEMAVRISAYRALVELGDANSAILLAQAAAGASDRSEQNEARNALYRLSDTNANQTIIERIKFIPGGQIEENTALEFVKSCPERQITAAVPALFAVAKTADRKTASEAVKALQSLATPDDLPNFVDLLIEKPNSTTENAIVVVAEKLDDRDQRANALLQKYPEIKDEKSRISALSVMGKIGDKHAVPLLEKEFASSNQNLRQAAFRAMTDWPGSDFLKQMKSLAQTGSDAKTKILAFRAYIRMLDDSAQDQNQRQIVDELIAAYPMAERADERKIIIGVLGHYGNARALDFVEAKLAEPSLQAEAEVSLVQISEKLLTRNPSVIKPVVQRLKNTSTNESVKKQAREMFEKIIDLEGFVLDWRVSGPYTSKGKNGNALFDVEFAPEKNPEQGQWRDAIGLQSKADAKVMNLNHLAQDDDRVAYLKTTLILDKAAPAVFEIGSDDGVKVWLNGQLIHANNAARPLRMGEDKIRVSLEKGSNQILVKVIQQAGEWKFCLKVTDENGNPVPGLLIDAGNQD